jgi:hypothetical protein
VPARCRPGRRPHRSVPALRRCHCSPVPARDRFGRHPCRSTGSIVGSISPDAPFGAAGRTVPGRCCPICQAPARIWPPPPGIGRLCFDLAGYYLDLFGHVLVLAELEGNQALVNKPDTPLLVSVDQIELHLKKSKKKERNVCCSCCRTFLSLTR